MSNENSDNMVIFSDEALQNYEKMTPLDQKRFVNMLADQLACTLRELVGKCQELENRLKESVDD